MNETILNGLLNLFAIFASLAKIESDQARQAVNSYLTSHFGIRSHKEYMEPVSYTHLTLPTTPYV